MQTLRRKHRQHIDKKLLIRLRLYFLISIILLGVVLFEIVSGGIGFLSALIGLGAGIIVGILSARMFVLTWDKNAQRVISRLDILGGVVLVCYIIFAIFRERIVGEFIQSNQITGISLTLVLGIMIGRVFGTGQKIVTLLKEEGLF